jgi:hypothetical protein
MLRHNNWAEAPHCTSTEAKGRMAWIIRARDFFGRLTRKSVKPRTQITRQTTRLEIDDQRLRQILHRDCSISADSAVLSSHHRRGFGNVVGNAGRMANVKVSVRLRTSDEQPMRHLGIKHALGRNQQNVLVEVNYKQPIREFFERIDRKNHHVHFGPAPDYVVDEFREQFTHLYLVMDDDQCVSPHHIPLSLAMKAVVA